MVKNLIIKLVDLWEKWSVFPKLLCQNLRFMFTSAYRDEVRCEQNLVEPDIGDGDDGVEITFSEYWDHNLDVSIDGEPIIHN